MSKKGTKAFSAIFVTLAAALLFSMSMSAAYATLPIAISGKILILGATYDSRHAGKSDNAIADVSLNGKFIGGIAGSFTSESRWVYHNAGQSDAWYVAHGVDTIYPATVTVDSVKYTGTLFFMIEGKSGEDGGTWVILGGTGDLAKLHGQGTYSPTGTTPQVAYEGQIHFDP